MRRAGGGGLCATTEICAALTGVQSENVKEGGKVCGVDFTSSQQEASLTHAQAGGSFAEG